MLKLAGELLEGQLADHVADLDAHTRNVWETVRVGEYYLNPTAGGTNYPAVADDLYARQLIVVRDMTVDRIAIHVHTAGAAGKKARLGIYNNGTNLYPGTLLLDAGTVDVDSIGVKAITINQSLPKGIYWAALITDGTPKIYSDYFLYESILPLGQNPTNFGQQQVTWTIASAYGALPGPFPGGASLTYSSPWKIPVRVASLD